MSKRDIRSVACAIPADSNEQAAIARIRIQETLAALTGRWRRRFGHVYVMGQRKEWGNCSRRRNLSFNWRLIMAPESVLRYLVAHEYVHLAVPDHSARFWLTLHGLCPDAEEARQWLVRHEAELRVDLGAIIPNETAQGTASRRA